MTARTPIDEARFREMWAAGVPTKVMAETFDRSLATIYQQAARWCLPSRFKPAAKPAKPRHQSKPAPPLHEHPHYLQIMAAVARGVKPGVIATWFRLKRGELAGVGTAR